MRSRFLAGWNGIVLAAAVATLIFLPALDTPAAEIQSAQTHVDETNSGLEDGGKLSRPTLYNRANYVWPFASGPYYGKVERASGVLLTQVGSFDLHIGLTGLPAELMTADRIAQIGVQHFIVQLDREAFTNGSYDKLKSAVEAAGGAFLREMPVDGFLVRLNAGAMSAINDASFVTAVVPYHPAFKLSPTIGRIPLSDPFKAVSDVYDLEVMLHEGEDANVVAKAIADLGGNVTSVFPNIIRAELHRNSLTALAALEPVYQIHEASPLFPKGEETTVVMQIGTWEVDNVFGPKPFHDAGIKGGGTKACSISGTDCDADADCPGAETCDVDVAAQVIMVLDSGIQLDGGELSHTYTDPGTPGGTHRKVRNYEATNTFGGAGDLLGCDAPTQGGSTHGHMVSATALGWGTEVFSDSYNLGANDPWYVFDDNNTPYAVDGVAPRAMLVAYDAHETPSETSCEDPLRAGLDVGTLYDGGTGGSLGVSYGTYGAKIANFSWGADNNASYPGNPEQIDDFIDDKDDAMVFLAAGNEGADDVPEGGDGIPDEGTVSTPATCKNCIVVGAVGSATDGPGSAGGGDVNDRHFFSSVGPATTTSNRIAPILMAPGGEFFAAGFGVWAEWACRSDDNDQSAPVMCDTLSGFTGTSFAAPAAAGSGALVRDYFAKGFYPDGTDTNPGNDSDKYGTISGAMVKAALIASAEWVGEGNTPGGNCTVQYRFNNEQGYGRIQLDRVLPLQNWNHGPKGLIVADGGITGGPNSTGLAGSISQGQTQETPINVCDDGQQLMVAVAWSDPVNESLVNDIDLVLISPTGKEYWGNYFTDDNNRDGSVDAGTEDCPSFDGTTGTADWTPWSLPKCDNSIPDNENPTEAVYLTYDPEGDGAEGTCSVSGDPCYRDGDCEGGETCSGSNSQLEVGDWTLRLIGTDITGSQDYAVAVSGGVCLGSSVRFDRGSYTCNHSATVEVTETDETDDPGTGLTPAEISGRTVVQVLDDTGAVIDEESGLTFTQPDTNALRFVSDEITLSAYTAPDPGNGALDVVDGSTLRVLYSDEASGVPDPDQERFGTAVMNCSTGIAFGDLQFRKWGTDGVFLIDGGCERNARGNFEYDKPDEYMDHGEVVGYRLAFENAEAIDLIDAEATLRCVLPDGDSPEDCRAGTNDCADPNRLNNTECPTSYIEILDSPKVLGNIPASGTIGANFWVSVPDSLTTSPEIEMVLGIKSDASGKLTEGYGVQRHTLNVDENSLYYSTDYPGGGVTEIWDYDNSETLENCNSADDFDCPTENVADFLLDYRFESKTWSSLTATGKNTGINSPWDFDSNDGGFTNGTGAITDDINQTLNPIAGWSEDRNWNNTLDAGEDRDPINGQLDRGWNTLGGCGWQTKADGETTGGIWHTGRIRDTGQTGCMFNLSGTGKCQAHESIIGISNSVAWYEVLLTPVVSKVNGADYTLNHINWAWNMNLQLGDPYTHMGWEFDTNTESLEPMGLIHDGTVMRVARGPAGAAANNFYSFSNQDPGLLTPDSFGNTGGGYPLFAPADNVNGSAGNDREGDVSCRFVGQTGSNPINIVGPPDDDLDNDGDSQIDEYVTDNGPIRNSDITNWNGPDMRFTTLEDFYGESADTFQAAFGFYISEPNSTYPSDAEYGIGIDDAVFMWREYNLTTQTADHCGDGECAALSLKTTNFYEGNALMTITGVEKSPDPANDCDLDESPDGTNDCDGDGTPDIVVEVYNDNRQDSEIVFLNQTGDAAGYLYRGTVSISAVFDVDTAPWNASDKTAYEPGSLFVQRVGTTLPSINVEYIDNDDGTGVPCPNDIDPEAVGLVQAGTGISYPAGRLSVAEVRLTDNDDNDGFADHNETVDMYITINNNSTIDLDNVVARISTNDSDVISCITNPVVAVGAMADGEVSEAADPFTFQVVPTQIRGGGDLYVDHSATFTVTFSSDQFDALFQPVTLTIDVDLDVAGGGTVTPWNEDFEDPGFGKFTSMTLDEGASGSNGASDGYRCQYHDPDFPGSNSYGATDCHLGAVTGAVDPQFDWHQHTTTSPDTGRAYDGTKSMHFGQHPGSADEDTYSLAQIDAVATNDPIFLDYASNPELTFKHQISLFDWRFINAPVWESPDRAVVMVQLSEPGGTAQGNWFKIYPYYNVYGTQGTDIFVSCLFDPTDDGNNEDDYFDPSDPDRRHGPSSTCYPEFTFTWLGDTDYRTPANPASSGGRSEPNSGLTGATGNGTWVESRFSLSRFRGRSIRLRFLVSTWRPDDSLTWGDASALPAGFTGDDGWYIDDIQIANALDSAATVSVDSSDNSGLPDTCATNCSALTPALTSDDDDDTLPAPGHTVTLSGAESTADRCNDGTLQYQYWIDEDNNDVLDGSDTLLRDWTDNAVYVAAPQATTNYGMKVRCSSATDCGGADAGVIFLTINVLCPTGTTSLTEVEFTTKNDFGWPMLASVYAVRGNLVGTGGGGGVSPLLTATTFTGTVETCLANGTVTNSINDTTSPASGSGVYYLMRPVINYCNAPATYSSGGSKESPDRDSELAADTNSCP